MWWRWSFGKAIRSEQVWCPDRKWPQTESREFTERITSRKASTSTLILCFPSQELWKRGSSCFRLAVHSTCSAAKDKRHSRKCLRMKYTIRTYPEAIESFPPQYNKQLIKIKHVFKRLKSVKRYVSKEDKWLYQAQKKIINVVIRQVSENQNNNGVPLHSHQDRCETQVINACNYVGRMETSILHAAGQNVNCCRIFKNIKWQCIKV